MEETLGPEQVSVYVEVVLGYVAIAPDVLITPVRPPEATHDVTEFDDQLTVTASPGLIDEGETVIVTLGVLVVGLGLGEGLGEGDGDGDGLGVGVGVGVGVGAGV